MKFFYMKLREICFQLLFITFSFALLSGCAAVPQPKVNIESDRIAQGSTVGTIWISPCSTDLGCIQTGEASTFAEFMPSGDKDALWYDKLIERHQEMIDALGTLSLVPIVEGKYSQPVERVLESAGFSVIVDDNNLYAGDLKTLKSTRTSFGPIAAKNYPRETAKDERVFDDWGYGEKFAESGEWKQKGDWSNVLKITTEALEVAIDRVMENFSTAIANIGPTRELSDTILN